MQISAEMVALTYEKCTYMRSMLQYQGISASFLIVLLLSLFPSRHMLTHRDLVPHRFG